MSMLYFLPLTVVLIACASSMPRDDRPSCLEFFYWCFCSGLGLALLVRSLLRELRVLSRMACTRSVLVLAIELFGFRCLADFFRDLRPDFSRGWLLMLCRLRAGRASRSGFLGSRYLSSDALPLVSEE